MDAIAHVLSTGQGVVLDRCVYSDFVFLEAMFSQGFVNKRGTLSAMVPVQVINSFLLVLVKNAYYELRDDSIEHLMRPHLLLYLDVPVNKVLENIKKRAIPYEKNSPALTPQYLRVMENIYKQQYLKEMR